MREPTERERADQQRARLHRLNTDFLTYTMTTRDNRKGDLEIVVYVSENGEPRERVITLKRARELRAWLDAIERESEEMAGFMSMRDWLAD